MDNRHVAYLFALWWAAFIRGAVNQVRIDNRCYLENGASSESFFVSEDLPVGSTIGQIRVHGDPRPGGSIALRLQESDSPISVVPGSKNLTLWRQLDKEGIDGPSSVFIRLICERLHTLDPGFVIPITIRVTDANDNAPSFINAPYELNISEVTVVGTRVLQGVHAVDADQQGPFSSIRYSVLPGPQSNYFEFENELEGTLVLRKPLDYETLQSFDVNIRAQDHGEPPKSADTILTVHVVDADDQNPKFLDDRYTASLSDQLHQGAGVNIKPRNIKAVDQDLGINAPIFYTFNGIGGDYSCFKLDRNTARVTLAKYLTDNDLIHPATLVIRATQQDNPDRYALVTLTVSRKPGDGLKFLKRVFYIRASESVPAGTNIGRFSTNRPGQPLRYFVSEQSILNIFSINPHGEFSLRKCLDYEEKSEYMFKVFATDGITNDSALVNVTVEDVNEWEPRFRQPHYEFFVTDEPTEFVGLIEAADGDKGDQLTFTLFGMNATLFAITSNGELRLRQPGEHFGLASLAITATDSGHPPRRASVPITVHFPNPPDAVTILSDQNSRGHLILAGLGGVLLILTFIVALLVAYICRARKRSPREELPALQQEKPPSTTSAVERIGNPMLAERLRVATASAMGGMPQDVSKYRLPSPKVHPAPQPPVWPSTAVISRVKKLSWGDDKTDSDSTDNMNNMDITPQTTENTNLTVYF